VCCRNYALINSDISSSFHQQKTNTGTWLLTQLLLIIIIIIIIIKRHILVISTTLVSTGSKIYKGVHDVTTRLVSSWYMISALSNGRSVARRGFRPRSAIKQDRPIQCLEIVHFPPSCLGARVWARHLMQRRRNKRTELLHVASDVNKTTRFKTKTKTIGPITTYSLSTVNEIIFYSTYSITFAHYQLHNQIHMKVLNSKVL